VSFRQSRVSQSVQGWPGAQKVLKTKLGNTVSTRHGLGTLGNPFSDLAVEKSYGIMLTHQNETKHLRLEIPYTTDIHQKLAALHFGSSTA
jgi:hypothetical protein